MGLTGLKRNLRFSQFQRAVNLSATGFVDPATWQRIEISQLLPSSGSTGADLESPPSGEGGTDSSALDPAAPPPPPDASVVETPTVETSNSSRPDQDAPLSTQSSPVSTPSQTAEPAPQESAGWLLWFLLVGIGLLSFGTGLFFAKRSANRSLSLDHSDDPRKIGLSAFDAKTREGQDRLPHTRVSNKLDRTNGLTSIQSHADQGITSTHPIAVENKTTRLSKVNIVDELVSELRGPDPAKRHKTIWELGQRGDSNAVQPLVDLIIDADSKERSLILAALSEIGIRVLKPMNRALALSLQDPNPEVRKNAIRDLTRVYDMAVQVSQMLTHVTEDPDPEVRETAYWALEQLNRIRSIPDAETLLSLRDSAKPGNLKDAADSTDFLPEEIQRSSEW